MKSAVVIYDGNCGFCETCKTWILRLDWFHRLQFRPYQEAAIFEDYPQLSLQDCEKEIQYISKKGRVFGGGDGFLRLCFHLPLVAPIAGLLWIQPLRWLVRWGYRWVAENRQRISGWRF